MLSSQAFAGHSFGLDFVSSSTTLDGASKSDSTTGTLVSNGNTNYTLLYSWSMSQYFHFKLNFGQKSYTLIDESGVINNGTSFSSSVYDLGLKFIFASWGAISLMQVNDFDLSYEVENGSEIKVNAENLSYMRIVYHQLLFNLRNMIFAFDVNYDLSGSNSVVENRASTGVKAYVKFNQNGWGMDLFYELQSITKENSSNEFTQSESGVGALFYLFF